MRRHSLWGSVLVLALAPACGGSVAPSSEAPSSEPAASTAPAPGASGVTTPHEARDASACESDAPTCEPSDFQVSSCTPSVPNCYTVTRCGQTVACSTQPHSIPVTVWSQDATKLEAIDEGGGFAPSGPPGSTCLTGEAHFTYVRATRALAWQLCNQVAVPWTLVGGQRTLSPTEAVQVEQNLSAVQFAANLTCGADKAYEHVFVTKPSGTIEYIDSFYSCQQKGTYVDGLDGVFASLRALAK